MKVMARKTCIMLLAASTLVSCTKNEDVNPHGGSRGGLLLLTEGKKDGVVAGRYEYNNDNLMTAFHTFAPDGTLESTIIYTYDEHGRVLLVTSKLGDGTVVGTTEHTYVGTDKMPTSATTVTYHGDAFVSNMTYSYVGDQLIETITWPAPTPPTVTTYTYNDKGDISSVEASIGGIWAGTTEYGDYDDKNSPSRLGNPYEWKLPSRHNWRSIKTIQSSGVTEGQVFKYTYNDADYPVKAEIYDHATGELLETHEYAYKKAH